eukprot:scaffold6580_cov29-Tisochrysis_lutea.AAC.9
MHEQQRLLALGLRQSPRRLCRRVCTQRQERARGRWRHSGPPAPQRSPLLTATKARHRRARAARGVWWASAICEQGGKNE